MKGRTSLVLAVGLAALFALVGTVSAANRGVRIGEANERYFFGPQTQYANVGDTVTWTNGTDAPHTVTSDSGSELASDNLADGDTFEHTFSAEGTFAYHCKIHTYMTAKVIVLAAGAALPNTDTSASGAARSGSADGTGPLLIVLVGIVLGSLSLRRFGARRET